MEEQREPVHVDALLEIAAACIQQARKDYAAGPTSRHYHSAQRFLATAGLLPPAERVPGCWQQSALAHESYALEELVA